MSAPTLAGPRSVFFYLPDYMGFDKPKNSANEGSPALYEKVPVFRSGTFRDSWGEQHTWTPDDMHAMVSNFESMRQTTVPNVPVRDQHRSLFGGGGEVVGWHTGLSAEERQSPHDQGTYTYLLADYEITEPDAAAKIERGTWRNRSAEVGRYTTNAEAEIWPAYMGFAYVDLPAVEGLNHSKPEDRKMFVFMAERGTLVTQPTPQPTPDPQAPAPTPQPTPTPAPTGPPDPQPTPAEPPVVPQSAPAAPVQPHGAPVQAFTINGQQVSDPIAVQRAITAYETAQRETRDANRKGFVQSLAAQNKITAPQITDTEAFALSLDDTQYGNWVKTWGLAPASSLLQPHGAEPTGATHAPATQEPSDLDTALEIVKQHQRANQTVDFIKKTSSYKKLEAAGKAPVL